MGRMIAAISVGIGLAKAREETLAERDREDRRRFREHEHQITRRPTASCGYLIYPCRVSGCAFARFEHDPDHPGGPIPR